MILARIYLGIAVMMFAIMLMFLIFMKYKHDLKWWMLLLATIACGIASFIWIFGLVMFIIAILHCNVYDYLNED